MAPDSDRTWPVPRRPWTMFMRWHDLAFLHWRVGVEQLRRHIPAALEIDTFDGSAWLGVVPFRMSGIRPRWGFPVPGLSAFPELNVRTYVTIDGKPGVWFFCLEATNPIAVRMARWWFYLPYMDARMSLQRNEWVDYTSDRTHRGEQPARFVGRYRPVGEMFHAHPGTLDYWLTARYCLYSADRQGQVYRGEIDHPPWPLHRGEAQLQTNTMTEFLGIQLPDEQPVVHFVDQIDVVGWTLERAGGSDK